jgi:predicted adenine nucleotide alpha hydrolase (AANH) superfamily ATPase
VLVHICCSVDSHFFLQRLKKEFPNEKLIGFFYDPNIHPYSEYQLRLLDVKRSCEKLGIELIEGEYDYKSWLDAVKGLENEPEKGRRCMVCFDKRLKEAAKKAKEIKEKRYTTTLLVSPLKSQEQLKRSAKEIDKELGTEFLFVDYRSKGGTEEQARVSKEQKLYRQNYCGCMFGLTIQYQEKERYTEELIEPVTKQILPNSIKQRLNLYQQRVKLEEMGVEYKIIKERFLNYRLLRGFVRVQKEVVPSYIIFHSLLRREFAKAKIEFINDGVGYANKDEIKAISLEKFNLLTNSGYKSVKELYFNPLEIDKEIEIREKIGLSRYDLSPLIVLDKIPSKLEVYIYAKSYKDVKEKLLRIKDA